MLTDPQYFLFFLALALLFYWALPSSAGRGRGLVLIIISCLFIYTLSPLALVFCLVISTVVWAAGRLVRGKKPVWWSGAGIVVIVGLLLSRDLYWDRQAEPLLTIGLAFVALKSIAALTDDYRQKEKVQPLPFSQVLLLNVFFPIYTAGPIERSGTFARENLSLKFDPQDLLYGLMRLVVGLFKIHFLAERLIKSILETGFSGIHLPLAGYGPGQAHLFIWLNFLYLYLNFSGYTDLAVGAGRLFGLRIMENFRFPVIARNIQNFWQRWHLSLANFVFRYLFVYLARRTRGRVELSIVISFVLVGLWHDLSLNYLVWGLCHGSALVAAAKYKRLAARHQVWEKLRKSRLHTVLSWYLTITLVAWLSAFANAGGFRNALVLTGRLVGL